MIKANLNAHEQLEAEYLYKMWLNFDHFGSQGVRIEKGKPIFSYFASVQEIDAVVKKIDHDEVIQGSDHEVHRVTYLIEISPHDADIQYLFGHNFEVTKFQMAGKLK